MNSKPFVYSTSYRAEQIIKWFNQLEEDQQLFYVFWSNMTRNVGQCQRTKVFRAQLSDYDR